MKAKHAIGILTLIGCATLQAQVLSDFEDSTLQGWSKYEVFAGDLFPTYTAGHNCIGAKDTCAGCGGLYVSAPPEFAGDLSGHAGLAWEEYIPNANRGDTEGNTGVKLIAPDGTIFCSIDPPRGPIQQWIPRFAPFEESAWQRCAEGSNSLSFSEVLSNVDKLLVQIEIGINDASLQEARLDNIQLIAGDPEPLILVQPASQSVFTGSNATFQVIAAGAAPLQYQWQFEEGDLVGETNAELNLVGVQMPDAGNYRVIITNSFGTVTSDVAVLSVDDVECYTISLSPNMYHAIANQLDRGGNTLNEVLLDVPEGSQLYKWNNELQKMQQAVFLSNEWHEVTCDEALEPLTLSPGEGAFLYSPSIGSVTFCGVRRTVEVPVTLHPYYNLVSRQIPEVAGYDEIVGSTPTPGTRAYTWLGSSYSQYSYLFGWAPAPFQVAVGECVWILPGGGTPPCEPPIIGTQPTSQTNSCGGISAFSVTLLQGLAQGDLSYTWYRNDIPVESGLTLTHTQSLILTNLTLDDAGLYWVAFSNHCGCARSFVASLEVLDVTAPVFSTCASNRTLVADSACQAILPDLTPDVVAVDDCGVVSLMQSPIAGTVLPSGDTVVTFTALDGWGNSNACTAIVTVVDAELPDILCPASIVAQCTGTNGAQVVFSAIVTDTCDQSPSLISVPPSGSWFSEGTNQVLCTAWDASGNTNTCTFLVIVQDPIVPTLSIHLEAGDVHVSWPHCCTDYVADEATNLTPPIVWSQISTPLHSTSNEFYIALPHEPDCRFYRLRKP